MNHRAYCLLAVIVALCLHFVQGSIVAADEQEQRSKVLLLVRDLGSMQLSKREKAEQQLLEMGPDVLGFLPKFDKRMSAECKFRLQRVQQKLEQAVAARAQQATVVTLEGRELSLEQVIDAFNQQTGNKLVDFRKRMGQRAVERKLDLKLDKVPFWPALDQVLAQAQLSVYHFSGEPGLALVARDANHSVREGNIALAGPFCVQAKAVFAERDLRRTNNNLLKLGVQLAWEPRLKPIALSRNPADIVAVDERGNSLVVAGTDSNVMVPVQPGTTASEFILPFELPPRSTMRIASLKARLEAIVPGQVEAFSFALREGDERVIQQKGGVTVVLESVRKNRSHHEVGVRIIFERTSGALESHFRWFLQNVCYVLDKEGKQIDFVAMETSRQKDNEVGLLYFFKLDEPLDQYKLIYETPAAILKMPVEYELKDIELP